VADERTKALLAIFDVNDQWEQLPLHEALVRRLQRRGIAGATVFNGSIGYGVHRRIHRKGLFGVVDDKPVAVLAIDVESNIRSVAPDVREMVREGVVVILDAELVPLLQPSTS
jgi:uncharacterized protein